MTIEPSRRQASAPTLSRRAWLRGAVFGGAGLGLAALVGCTLDEDPPQPTPDATSTPASAGTATATAQALAVQESPEVTAMNRLAEASGSPYPFAFDDPPGDPVEGGTLRIAVSWEIGSWDLSKGRSGGSTAVPDAAYNRLLGFRHGPDASKLHVDLEPELARSWEPAPDGLSYTFHLAEGVAFQDVDPVAGRAFGADDVLFAFQRQASEGANRDPFALVTDMHAVDAATFRMTLAEPSADFLVPLALRWMGIYPRELVELELIDTRAIGTGPLIVRDVRDGEHVRLATNPDYWEPNRTGRTRPWLDGLEFRLMPDADARREAFLRGEVDFASGIPRTPAEAEELRGANPGVRILADPILASGAAVGFNLDAAKYQDDRIRQALMLGIDRELNLQVLYDGDGAYVPTAAWPFVLDEPPAGDALGRWWRHAPDEARTLLAAAGAGGLQIELLTSPGYDPLDEAELFSAQWGDLGVSVVRRDLDPAEFDSQWIPREYEDAADGWATSAPTADGFYFDQVHSQSPDNRWYIDDPEIDAWAEQQRAELDPEARRQLHRRIWDRLLERAYRIENAQTFALTAYQPWLRFARFNGPHTSYHWFYRWGDAFPDLWLATSTAG